MWKLNRKLNAVTIKDAYALPRIDDALATLQGNRFFSSLDCAQGYWQLALSENAKPKSAFISDEGLFQWNVMSFSLTYAPATFQRYMDAVLAGLNWNILLVYIDDILVFSKNFSDHLRYLGIVFDRLKEAQVESF